VTVSATGSRSCVQVKDSASGFLLKDARPEEPG
jgi:hypothetical protein